jgi:uncharacterized membrane protein YhfC
MKSKMLFIWTILIGGLFLSACAAQAAPKIEGAYVTGSTLKETSAGQRDVFNITVKDGQEKTGFDFRGTLTQGEIAFRVVDASGNVPYEKRLSGTNYMANESVALPAGDYRLLVVWQGPVTGTYNVEWKPGQVDIPRISPVALVPGLGMLIVGLLFSIYGIRKGGWRYAALGAAFWAGTVIIKFVIASPANGPLYKLVSSILPGLPGTLLFSLYVGLLTGITEVLITWLFLRYTRFGQTVWNKIIAFGLGFGGIEAILLGVNSILGIIAAMTMTNQIPPASLRSIAQANNIIYGLAPILERIFTIGVHLGCNVLLFYAALKMQNKYFWYSFALKSGIDAVAGYAQLSGNLSSTAFLWAIEVAVVLFGLVGFWVTRRLKDPILAMEEQRATGSPVEQSLS